MDVSYGGPDGDIYTFRFGPSSFAGSKASVLMSTVQCPGLTAAAWLRSTGDNTGSLVCPDLIRDKIPSFMKVPLLHTYVIIDDAEKAVKPECFLLMLDEPQGLRRACAECL